MIFAIGLYNLNYLQNFYIKNNNVYNFKGI